MRFLLALALLTLPVAAQTIRIEFEALPGPDGVLGTIDDVPIVAPSTFATQPVGLTSEFAALGVEFTPNPPTPDANEILNSSSFTTPAGHTTPNILCASGALQVRGSFTVPVSRVAALIGISGGSDMLEIFDAGGLLLGSGVGDDIVVSLTSGVPIASFVIRPASGSTVALDNFEFDVAGPSAPVVYCTAGTTTNGCNAAISVDNQPSVSFAHPCNITVANVEGQKLGLVFYSISGRNNQSWGTGSTSFLCVKTPTQRSLAQNSGGVSGLCGGVLSLDWNAFQSSTPGALGQPWGTGSSAFVQGWFRDPPAFKTTNLSDAVELTYLP